MKPRVFLAYQYGHPDEVVSARHFTQLGESLVELGHEVFFIAGNRFHSGLGERLPRTETHNGVTYLRTPAVGPPARHGVKRLAQAAVNSLLVSLKLLGVRKGDAVILGTDPQLAVLAIPEIRRLRKANIYVWAFDIFPDAVAADRPEFAQSRAFQVWRALARRGYNAADAVATLAPCMERRLRDNGITTRTVEIIPWALVEDTTNVSAATIAQRRSELFGDARLGLLYSGNLGLAHDVRPLVDLMRVCGDRFHGDVRFAFGIKPQNRRFLDEALNGDGDSVKILPLCSEAQLAERLLAADAHVVSVREGWDGIVVPSKFFAALAMGRPVLYSGTERSGLSQWTRELDIGLDTNAGMDETLAQISRLLGEPDALSELQDRAAAVYQERFTREAQVRAWSDLIS
jgi:glycosyltransferase involved in cell wall biosynthesis